MQASFSVDSQAVIQARNELLSSGNLQKGVVAEAIERSWRRCIANGINADSPLDNSLLSQQELAEKRDISHMLLASAKPEMASLHEQIAHTRSMIVLTDAEGVILHSLGNSSFLDAAQRISLSPGYSWHESHRGTNAIGTALMEQKPISVHGAEHFVKRLHGFSCSAVPIFGEFNQLIGTLDVSNAHSVHHHHTLALVRMAAQMIENRIFRASHQGEVVIHFHARPEFIDTLWESTAVFSAEGKLIALNRSAQLQFETVGHNTEQHFDDLFGQPLGQVVNSLSKSSQTFTLRLNNGARVFARIEIEPSQVSATPAPAATLTKIGNHYTADMDALNSGDPQIEQMLRQIRLVMNQDIPILIQGETGVGKELLARAIHKSSDRREGPWVAVNCAALPEGLIESELFGYEEGAFTGARRRGSQGKVEQADGGVLFLDEIGDMPLALQARLLRVLQDRSITPLGSNKSRSLDIAIISATNHDLQEKVARGEFRSDLYYRLNGLSVTLPALRQRSDMEKLIQALKTVENAQHVPITTEVIQLFKKHPWPGNIRQLHNVIKTAVALSNGDTITEQHLTRDFLAELSRHRQPIHMSSTDVEKTLTITHLDSITNEAVRQTMSHHAGNISAAARELGISRNTLYRKLKSLGLI